MSDLEQQFDYWRDGAGEDWEVAQELISKGKVRHGMFFAHLALEKMLKALVFRQTRNTPPRIHNLSRLAELAGLSLSESQSDFLADMNAFQMESRYPDRWGPPPSREEAQSYINMGSEILEWLMKQ